AFEPLSLSLIDQLKRSGSFELTVKIIDSEGEFIQQVYGIKTKESSSGSGSGNGMLDISVDRIEVEDDTIVENENNYLVISESKKKLDVDVFLTSLEDIEDARVEAILTLENGDVVSDVSNVFDISDEATVRKSLELPFIGSFLQSDFKLKIKIIDSEGDFEEKIYGIKLTKQKFPFVVNTVTLGSESIASGRSLDVKVNYRNIGTSTVDFASLVISIPELGVITSKPIGSSSPGSEMETEFSVKIPAEAEAGVYTVSAEIQSRNAIESESSETEIQVTEPSGIKTQNEKLLITVPVSGQDITNDGTEAVYPLTFKNAGTEAKTYSLKFDSQNVNLRLGDSSIFVLNAGESKTINLYVSYKGDEFAGDQKIIVTVESKGEVLKQIPLRATVAGETKNSGTFMGPGFLTMLMISLIVIVIALAMLGLYFGIKMADSKEEYFTESVAYASEIPDASPEGELYY
ncbi:MAG TPA: hypothetical protein VI564_09545, partial [Candidatus Nanoarchaeia archaeon]|nr:hypothetical protein [Candidatus Nanoarchaeia archaeon]